MDDIVRAIPRDALIGFGAGFLAKTLVAPLERVRLLNATRRGSGYVGNMLGFIRQSIWNDGVTSFWRNNMYNASNLGARYGCLFAFRDAFKAMYGESRSSRSQLFCNYFVGGAAGLLTLLLTEPIDRCRTVVAMQHAKAADARKYTSVSDCMRRTLQAEGIKGLYAGLRGSYILYVVMHRAAFLGMYDSGKTALGMFRNDITAQMFMAYASMVSAGFLAYPIEAVHRRMLIQEGLDPGTRRYASATDCFRRMLREEGAQSFFKGALSGAGRGVATGIALVAYDQAQFALSMAGRRSGREMA